MPSFTRQVLGLLETPRTPYQLARALPDAWHVDFDVYRVCGALSALSRRRLAARRPDGSWARA